MTGLGAFNVSTLYALNADPRAVERVAWTKSAPYLKLPSVSTPAQSGGTSRGGPRSSLTASSRCRPAAPPGGPASSSTWPPQRLTPTGQRTGQQLDHQRDR